MHLQTSISCSPHSSLWIHRPIATTSNVCLRADEWLASTNGVFIRSIYGYFSFLSLLLLLLLLFFLACKDRFSHSNLPHAHFRRFLRSVYKSVEPEQKKNYFYLQKWKIKKNTQKKSEKVFLVCCFSSCKILDQRCYFEGVRDSHEADSNERVSDTKIFFFPLQLNFLLPLSLK